MINYINRFRLKAYNRIWIAVLLMIGPLCAVLYTSCSKSKCGGTTCQNGATCTTNVCVCPIGYSGTSCEKGWTDGAVGTYNCTRANCVPGVANAGVWQSAVTKAATNSGYTINIANFDHSNVTVAGVMDSLGNIRISPAGGTYGISATGNYINNTITLQFSTYSSGALIYSCTMNMTKI